MISGQPDQKQEKDAIGAEHLHLFGSGHCRSEGDTKFGGGDGIARHVKDSIEQSAGQKENPERKRDLPRSQESKPNKGRIDIDFQFVKPGE